MAMAKGRLCEPPSRCGSVHRRLCSASFLAPQRSLVCLIAAIASAALPELAFSAAAAFVLPPSPTSSSGVIGGVAAARGGATGSEGAETAGPSVVTGVKAIEPFDFASLEGWDNFYSSASSGVDGTGDGVVELEEYEWHPSLPHSAFASCIPRGSSIIVIGCGSSSLPRYIYDVHEGETSVCCLDYSSACVDALRERDGSGRERMTFVRADATRLEELEWDVVLSDNIGLGGPSYRPFDVVIDKGLIDALMCGEGWDYDVQRLIKSVSSILKEDGGLYLLGSFKLSSSTKEFLVETGGEVGMAWEFSEEAEKMSGSGMNNGRAELSRGVLQRNGVA